MILDLPDLRQRDNYGCGRVAAAIVHAHLGTAKGRHPHATPIDGTDPAALEASLWKSGVAVQAGAMDAADLKYHTGRGRPVVALVTDDGEGHWLVVAGVSRGWVYFQCPLRGPGRERVGEFEARWEDATGRRGVAWTRWGIACW